FKYVEADGMYQYLKLEKKIAAGADVAITQVGWDAAKFEELSRYVHERGLGVPLLGNVYVLAPKAAEKMAKGQPPGCWVSPELLAAVRAESATRDGGLRARLERAAVTVAILRGLGYAGAYLGGTHDADAIAWIIRRAEALAPRWQELAAELTYGRPDGFYLYGAPARPRTDASTARRVAPPPRAPARAALVPRALDAIGRLFPVTRETWLRRRLRALAAWADRRPAVAAAVERVEMAVKRPTFGC